MPAATQPVVMNKAKKAAAVSNKSNAKTKGPATKKVTDTATKAAGKGSKSRSPSKTRAGKKADEDMDEEDHADDE